MTKKDQSAEVRLDVRARSYQEFSLDCPFYVVYLVLIFAQSMVALAVEMDTTSFGNAIVALY